jgi:fibronectin type 3 domain-containing protein
MGLRFLSLLFALSVSGNSVTLNWLHGAGDVPDYRVYKSEGSCPKFSLTKANLSTTTWTDKNVQPGKTYCYYVTDFSTKLQKESGPSNEIKVSIP